MRYVTLADATLGMRLAYDIFDSQGHVLLAKDSELDEAYVEKLIAHGIEAVYVTDELSAGVEIKPVIPVELRAKGMECVRKQNIEQCKNVAEDIVQEIVAHGIISMDMADLRTYDDYTFAHSVNVAVIACEIGLGLNLKKEELIDLVTAGLVHDLGKLSIPVSILGKPGRLTGEEYAIMQSHVTKSYDLVKDRTDLSDDVKLAVLCHHENVDGSGYPCGLVGMELNLMSRILHVADVYDALVSKRPYKVPYSPSEATEYLMGGCGIMFDKLVVEALLRFVPIYPKGMQVTLSDGREGIVVENSHYHNLRPLLKMMDGTDLDLTHMGSLNITVFNITAFSVANAMESEEQRRKMVRESFSKYNVMIVDDEEENINIIKSLLNEKHRITVLNKGAEVIAHILTVGKPDLIIMDVKLPDGSGIDVANRIRELQDGKIPIMFVTDNNDRQTVIACMQAGASGYVVKPFKSVFFKTEVNRIINGRTGIE